MNQIRGRVGFYTYSLLGVKCVMARGMPCQIWGEPEIASQKQLSVDRVPGIVWVVLGHRRCNGLRVGAQVFLVDDTIRIDDKGHDARILVLGGVRDKSKSPSELAIHDIILCSSFACRSLLGKNSKIVPV